ncbi:MAG: branched-chain amino acid transport system substrate-binding protein [Thermodesulfobacteriota bacterium]|nr:branched-chain amino acid transport system substrate-binding protein [Thermodesulfobacteriota bacterium]
MMRFAAICLFLVLALVSPTLGADPILIGAYMPMTGSVAGFGQMCWSGIEVAKKMEPEVLGRPVEMKLVDTKSEKADSANAVSRLIEKEKVVAILGETISGNTIAGSDYAERRKIPMISPTATNPIVTQGKKYVFRVCFIDTDQGLVGARLALDTLKAKSAALIYDISQDYSVGLANFFKKEFTAGGGQIVSETKFKSGDRDFSPQLSRIKSLNPDIIYAPIYYTELALIAKQAREMGLKAPIVAGDGAQAPELIELGGPAVEDIYFTAHFHEDMVNTERGKKFLAKFKAETGKPLDSFTAMGADAYYVTLDAIRRAGSVDPTQIRDALVKTKDFEGVSGKISLKEDGNAIKEIVINKVKDGKFTYVTTITP